MTHPLRRRAVAAPRTAGGARSEPAAGIVDRPRLVERLSAGARGPLTVVTAPAGSGKSVLIGQWAAREPGPVACATLRPGEGASRLAPRLVAALGDLGARVGRDALEGVGTPGHGLGERFVSVAAAALEPLDRGILVLDGLDAPTDATIVEQLRQLIGHVPARVPVVVAQRSHGAAAPVLYGRGAGLCVDETDLAFTADEARRLLWQAARRDLASRQVDALLERTEGWAAGLRLAALALRQVAVPEAVIDGLAGDDRYLAGYFRDEVLAGQPAGVLRFVARTSVLDRLCGPLCDAVTGTDDGQAMLPRLEERGLFTRRLHPGGAWFRYHPLFRDVMRRELRRREPDTEGQLLVRAAGWHLGRGELGVAAGYLVEAGDEAHLIEVIDRYGRLMFERGAADEVLRWLDAVPGTRDPRRLDLAMRRAYLQTMAGNTRLADEVVHDIDGGELGAGERVAIEALRATWTSGHAAPATAIRAADAVLATIDALDPDDLPDIFGLTRPASLRTMAACSRARALWCLGEVAASRRALDTLVRQHDAYLPWQAHAAGALALLEAWAGNLRVALEHAARALAVVADAHLVDHPASIDARLAMAHVARERGQLHRAGVLLAQVDRLVTRTHRPLGLTVHRIERALWHLAAGRPELGRVELERNRANGDPPAPRSIDARQRAAEMRLLIATGEIERARAILDGAAGPGGAASELAGVAVQLAVAQHDLGAAADRLDRWHPDGAEPAARRERDLWAAILRAEAGDRHEARRRAERLVTEAEAEGHVRLFLDAGRPAERLLRDLQHASPTPYVRRLLDAAPRPPGAGVTDTSAGMSGRELQVARYLPTSLSNAEIAARLYISVNTLKTHLRAIYRKLGVTTRRAAIERTERLGIA